jgi:hypothetical protein
MVRNQEKKLPAKVRKGTIGLRHAVGIILLLHNRAGVVVGIGNLGRRDSPASIRGARTGSSHEPAESKALLPLKADFEGNLIGRSPDTTAFDFQLRTNVLKGPKNRSMGSPLPRFSLTFSKAP